MSGRVILTVYAIDSGRLVAVKAIREALRTLAGGGERPGLSAANDVFDQVHADGQSTLGECSVAAGRDLIAALEVNGVFATMETDIERAKQRHAADGAAPEDVFAAQAPGEAPEPAKPFREDAPAATALALTVMCEGNPLAACAQARVLSIAQGGDPVFWRGVQQFIILTYPWIKGLLEKDGALL